MKGNLEYFDKTALKIENEIESASNCDTAICELKPTLTVLSKSFDLLLGIFKMFNEIWELVSECMSYTIKITLGLSTEELKNTLTSYVYT